MKKTGFCCLLIFAFSTPNVSGLEIGASWEFNQDGDSEGWDVDRSLADLTVADGLLTTSITGYQASFAGPKELDISAGEYGFILIRMRVTDGLWGKLSWKTDSGLSESVTFAIVGDTLFHEYEIPVFSKVKWVDTITEFTKLQIQAPIGSEIKIDYIRVVSLGQRFEVAFFKPLRTVFKPNESIPLIASIKNSGSHSGTVTATLVLPDQFTLISGDPSVVSNEMNVGDVDSLYWIIQSAVVGDYRFGFKLTWSDTCHFESSFEKPVVDQYWEMDQIVLSTWGGPERTEEGYAEYRNAHFNKILSVAPTAVAVEYAESQGFECMVSLYNVLGASPYLRGFDDQPAYEMTEEMLEKADPIIEEFRDNPAVTGYYICDEPCVNAFDNLAKVVAYLKKKDPHRLAFINLYPCYGKQEHFGEYTYEEYVERFLDIVKPELLCYDHYHFKIDQDGREYFYNLELARKYARRYDIPFYNIVQGQSIPSLNGRTPTSGEYRFLNFSTCACGGKGILYYSWSRMKADPAFDTVIYPTVQKLNQEIQALNRVLFGLRSEAVYHTPPVPPGCEMLPANTLVQSVSNNAEITIGFFTDADEQEYIMLMNRDCSDRAETTVHLNRSIEKLEYFDCDTEEWSDVVFQNTTEGVAFDCSLPPGGGLLYHINASTAVLDNQESTAPIQFTLEQNYPNPFNPMTTIHYSLAQATSVKLTVYDITGRKVDILVNEKQRSGDYNVVWDAQRIPSGLYIFQLQAGSGVQSRKMVVLK
ncbi:T9SS type A sorting domain-containing protein [candidate division KSB1 bacterium]|nr:T9SS type A sorting domain-containing protein [candidate division KSB1 bacterium]